MRRNLSLNVVRGLFEGKLFARIIQIALKLKESRLRRQLSFQIDMNPAYPRGLCYLPKVLLLEPS